MEIMKVTTEGTGATTGAASAVVEIPLDSSGVRAEKVYITAAALSYVLPGYVGSVATMSSIIIDSSSPLLLDVRGLTHIAHLRGGSDQPITFTPVD